MKRGVSCIDPEACPSPAAVMTWMAEGGAIHLLETAWLGVICSRPATLSLALKSSARLCESFRTGAHFVVNLPPADQLSIFSCSSLDDFRIPLEKDIQGTPQIPDCPVRIECRYVSCSTHFGQSLVQGEILAVHVGRNTFKLDGFIDFGRLNPLTGNPDLAPARSWVPWDALALAGASISPENLQ